MRRAIDLDNDLKDKYNTCVFITCNAHEPEVKIFEDFSRLFHYTYNICNFTNKKQPL